MATFADHIVLGALKHPRLPHVLSVAIAAVLALQVSVAASSLVRRPASVAMVPVQAPAARVVPALDVAQLVAAHLFGESAAQAATIRPATLDLELVGTYAGTEPADGMAIVREAGAQHVYRSGDEMSGGAILREVYSDRIVFEHAGHNEEVDFPHSGLEMAEAPSLHAVETIQVEDEEPAQQEPEPEAADKAG